MGEDQGRSGRLLAAAMVLICLIILASVLISAAFVGTMGVVVIVSVLFLLPRHVVILAGLAAVLALLMIPLESVDAGAVRAANVILGCITAVILALVLAKRTRREMYLHARERAILQSVPDAILVIDRDGVVQRANDELLRLVPDAAEGKRLHHLLAHELGDGSECAGICALSGDSDALPSAAVEWISPTGRRVPITYSVAPLDENLSVLTMRDMTDQVNADSDRRVLIEEAARQAAQAQAVRTMSSLETPPGIPGLQIDLWTGDPEAPWPGSVDVREMDDGRVLILIAEGKGDRMQAARDAWRALYVARAHANAGLPMAELIERTAITLEAEPEPTRAAMLALSLDPDTGFVTVVGAGHPPALLVRSPGTSEWLQSMGQALGSEHPGSANLIVKTLGIGDSVVLFSDGTLTPEDKLASLSALRSAAVALRNRSTEGWAHHLADVVVPDLADRCMVMVARLATTEADHPRELSEDASSLIASLAARPKPLAGPSGPP